MNPADRIGRDAINWAYRLKRGELSPRQLRRFNRWLRVKEHQQEFARTVASQTAPPVTNPIQPRRNRRLWRWVVPPMLILTALPVVYFQNEEQTYSTRVGEFGKIGLADGSQIELNTHSTVRVRYSKKTRDLRLLNGEGRFHVARDPERLFEVTAGNAKIVATGTEFAVRVKDRSRVETVVVQGTVLVDAGKSRPQAGSAGDLLVTNGTANIKKQKLNPSELERRLSWNTGRITFTGETVAEGVAEFNRYHDIKIVIADPRIASRPLGGTFNVSDVEGFVSGLNITFGLQPDPANQDASQIRLIAVSDKDPAR